MLAVRLRLLVQHVRRLGGRARDEDAPLKPITAYAESKVRSEEALAELADDDFSPVFMRNATVYGVSPRLRLDIVLNNLVGWAFTTGAVRILSDGTPWRPSIHVADVADATVALLEAPRGRVHGQAFNVGPTPRTTRYATWPRSQSRSCRAARSSTAAQATPTRGATASTSGSSPGRCPSSASAGPRARARRSSIDAYQAAGLTFEEFDGPRFTRLKRLRSASWRGELDEELRRR